MPRKWMPCSRSSRLAPLGVGEERVAAVDDDVARFEKGEQLVDHVVDGRARLHHDHDRAGSLSAPTKSSHRRGRAAIVAFAAVSCTNASVFAVVRLCTTIGKPWRRCCAPGSAHHRQAGEPDLCELAVVSSRHTCPLSRGWAVVPRAPSCSSPGWLPAGADVTASTCRVWSGYATRGQTRSVPDPSTRPSWPASPSAEETSTGRGAEAGAAAPGRGLT